MTISAATPLTAFWIMPRLCSMPLASPAMKSGIQPKAFYDALNAANIPETCRQEKGNIRYHYFLPVDNDNQLFLLEIWEDKDSLKAHQQTPHFKTMPAIKDQFVEKTDCVRYDTL